MKITNITVSQYPTILKLDMRTERNYLNKIFQDYIQFLVDHFYNLVAVSYHLNSSHFVGRFRDLKRNILYYDGMHSNHSFETTSELDFKFYYTLTNGGNEKPVFAYYMKE